MGAARDKNHNSFSARGGEKVAHYCTREKSVSAAQHPLSKVFMTTGLSMYDTI